MSNVDRRPLRNAPSSPLIRQFNDNRFGAVLSSLYGFWLSKAGNGQRRDAYSVITFDADVTVSAADEFCSSCHNDSQ